MLSGSIENDRPLLTEIREPREDLLTPQIFAMNGPTEAAIVIALPMKIAGGSGAPLRIVAILPQAGTGEVQP